MTRSSEDWDCAKQPDHVGCLSADQQTELLFQGLHARASQKLIQLGISRQHSPTEIYKKTFEEHLDNYYETTVDDRSARFQLGSSNYILNLTETRQRADCFQGPTQALLRATVRQENSKTEKVLQNDRQLKDEHPRRCASGYRIESVHTLDGKQFVAFVQVILPFLEDPLVRYMVITARLD
jgi:hypothetical protein